jgi:hypothetical protein
LDTLGNTFGRWLWGGNAIEPVKHIEIIAARGWLLLATLSRANEIERTVGTDTVEPSAEGGTAIETVNLFVSAKESFLNQILGIVFIASHTERQTKNGMTVTLDEDTKGVLVPLTRLFGRG